MGRRKIEIQPITRKNGLFKKAYELGVLCSVEIAVIIFEERPGHNVKLHQYGSADVNDIVQRHQQYEGDIDTRRPSDFGNSSPSKMQVDEDEEDEVEDDLPEIRVTAIKRSHDDSSKPENGGSHVGASRSADRANRGQPVSESSSHLQSSLPVSGERHSHMGMPSAGDPRVAKRSRSAEFDPADTPRKGHDPPPRPFSTAVPSIGSSGGTHLHPYASAPGAWPPQYPRYSIQFHPYQAVAPISPPHAALDFALPSLTSASRASHAPFPRAPSSYHPHPSRVVPMSYESQEPIHREDVYVQPHHPPAPSPPDHELFAALMSATEHRPGQPPPFDNLEWPAASQPAHESAPTDSNWLEFLSANTEGHTSGGINPTNPGGGGGVSQVSLASSSPNPSAGSRERSWERNAPGHEGVSTRASSASNATTEMRDDVGNNGGSGVGENVEEEAVTRSVSTLSD